MHATGAGLARETNSKFQVSWLQFMIYLFISVMTIIYYRAGWPPASHDFQFLPSFVNVYYCSI